MRDGSFSFSVSGHTLLRKLQQTPLHRFYVLNFIKQSQIPRTMAVLMSFFKPSVVFFHRRLLIRASLFLNFCVLTYVALQAAQNSGVASGLGNSGGRSVNGRLGLSDNFNLPSGVQIVFNSVEKTQTESFSRENPMSTKLIFMLKLMLLESQLVLITEGNWII